MWYSSKNRYEKADRPSKVKNIVSCPGDHGEHMNGTNTRSINRNKKKVLLNNKAIGSNINNISIIFL